jgi:spermidine synthase
MSNNDELMNNIFWDKITENKLKEIFSNDKLLKIYKSKYNDLLQFICEQFDQELREDIIIVKFINKILNSGKENYDKIMKGHVKGFMEHMDFMSKIYQGKMLYSIKSKYQQISVYDTTCGRMLIIDGDIQFIDRDEHIYHEMMVHVPLAMKPQTKNVLIIGAGDGGICRELIKHNNVKEIHQIEIDERVVETCKKYFPKMASSFNNSRVKLIYEDANKWINNQDNMKRYYNYYDIIIMDTTDFNASDSLFDDIFFEKLKNYMKYDSILVFNGDCMNWYLDTIKILVSQQRKIFKYVRVYQAYLPMYGDGHYGFIMCSDYMDPLNWIINEDEFNMNKIETKYYTPEIHKASFILPNNVERLLNGKNEKNKLGFHLIIDLKIKKKSVNLLNNEVEIMKKFDKIANEYKFNVLNKSHHKFVPHGVTICYLLSESHMAIHTWPEKYSACIDIFSCNKYIDCMDLLNKIILYFDVNNYCVKHFDRKI